MNLFNALAYLNKISLVAFFVTAMVLIYQVVIMKKEHSKKNTKPVIPDFNENMTVPVKNFTAINEEKLIHKSQPMSKTVLYLIVGVTLVCLILVVYLIGKQNQIANNENNNAVVENISPTKIALKPQVSPKISPTMVPSPKISPTITLSLTPLVSPTVSLTVSPLPKTSPSTTSSASLMTPSQGVPTRIPTNLNNEVVVAYNAPTGNSISTTSVVTVTGSTKTLPLTGMIENTIVVGVISGFLIMLAFVF